MGISAEEIEMVEKLMGDNLLSMEDLKNLYWRYIDYSLRDFRKHNSQEKMAVTFNTWYGIKNAEQITEVHIDDNPYVLYCTYQLWDTYKSPAADYLLLHIMRYSFTPQTSLEFLLDGSKFSTIKKVFTYRFLRMCYYIGALRFRIRPYFFKSSIRDVLTTTCDLPEDLLGKIYRFLFYRSINDITYMYYHLRDFMKKLIEAAD